MAVERIQVLHLKLNASRFNGLGHYRRNRSLYQVTTAVNCLIGCVISHNVEIIPTLVQRCRSATATVNESSALGKAYVEQVETCLQAVEDVFRNQCRFASHDG